MHNSETTVSRYVPTTIHGVRSIVNNIFLPASKAIARLART